MRFMVWRAVGALVLAGLSALLVPLEAARADPPTPGQTVWTQRCQSCHEPAVGHAPDRAALAARSGAQIEQALTTGAMKPMASGLSAADIKAVADYLTGGRPTAAAIVGEPKCAANPPIRPGPSDWASLGVDERSTRYQTRPGLRAADVPRLKLKWAFALSGGGQPTVVGDWLFITNRNGKFYALDAHTGCVRWVTAGVVSRTTPMIVRSKISPSGWATFVGVDSRSVRAIDAQTGKDIWKSPPLESHPFTLLTGSPVAWGDRLYVPISSYEEVAAARPTYACCSFRGSLVALDVKTGSAAVADLHDRRAAALHPHATRREPRCRGRPAPRSGRRRRSTRSAASSTSPPATATPRFQRPAPTPWSPWT